METKFGFTKFAQAEFLDWIAGVSVARTVSNVQEHHTWKPRYENFTGTNHFDMQRGMKLHHVNTNGWSDIGQHFTIFPDGAIVTGRPLNKSPACIFGANARSICIENLGNSDQGGDQMRPEQREAILQVTAALLKRFGMGAPSADSIVYHHWYDAEGNKKFGVDAVKSCPGTAFFGGNKLADFEANFLPGVVAAMTGAPPAPASVEKWVAVTSDRLPIRSAAAADASKTGEVEMGAILRVFEERSGWYRVSNSRSHWAFGRHTQPVQPAVVNTDGTNCRTGPGMNFDVIESLDTGRRVFIREGKGNWRRIAPDGWIHHSLLTPEES